MEVAQKPTFYSDSDFFIVTLPNRSVATPAQVSMESVASGAESAETCHIKKLKLLSPNGNLYAKRVNFISKNGNLHAKSGK